MAGDRFVYVIHIRTTPEALWEALTSPEILPQYWFDFRLDCDWTPGARWTLMLPDRSPAASGTVVEIDRPRRFVLDWQDDHKPELKAEGVARGTYTLEPRGDLVKLTYTHEIGRTDSQFVKSVANVWPMILSSLKSMLETGKPFKRG